MPTWPLVKPTNVTDLSNQLPPQDNQQRTNMSAAQVLCDCSLLPHRQGRASQAHILVES